VTLPTTPLEAVFEEVSAQPKVTAVPMSHLSVELGHLYLDDILAGPDRLAELAHQIAPWARAAVDMCGEAVAPKRPRISTSFLIDDYFSPVGSPRDIVPMILSAARDAGLSIDYLVREAACASHGSAAPAALVLDHLVADPEPGTNGARPPARDSGWLCNGVRSPNQLVTEAMAPRPRWRPPVENGAARHSIFLDVQLWDQTPEGRRWSCPFLASVWQLLRLGLLRSMGQPVFDVCDWDQSLPATWAELPAILRVEPRAAPFAAYRTFSVLPSRFLPVEHAVRTILSQVAIEDAVHQQVAERAAGERLTLPLEVVSRIMYAFVGSAWRVPTA